MPHQPRAQHEEHRAQPRVKCDVVFNGARVTASGDISDHINFTIIEISANGVRFRCTERFAPGDEAIVEMIGRTGAPGLVGLTIVHGTPESNGELTFGASFTAMRPEVLRAMMGEAPAEVRRHRASA